MSSRRATPATRLHLSLGRRGGMHGGMRGGARGRAGSRHAQDRGDNEAWKLTKELDHRPKDGEMDSSKTKWYAVGVSCGIVSQVEGELGEVEGHRLRVSLARSERENI